MKTVLSYHKAYIIEVGDHCCDFTPAWNVEAPVLAQVLRAHLASGTVPAGRYLVTMNAANQLEIRIH